MVEHLHDTSLKALKPNVGEHYVPVFFFFLFLGTLVYGCLMKTFGVSRLHYCNILDLSETHFNPIFISVLLKNDSRKCEVTTLALTK